MPAPSPTRARRERQRRYRKGQRGEMLAAVYFRLCGWRILARRYKTPYGEIDLIATRGKVIAFVEVKARKEKDLAAESIHRRNQQRVMQAAQIFLQHHPRYASFTIRFDACLIPWYGWPYHISDAFS
jgi:putative endonuclease